MAGQDNITKISLSGEVLDQIEVKHTSISDLSFCDGNAIYVGSSPTTNTEVCSLNLNTKNFIVHEYS